MVLQEALDTAQHLADTSGSDVTVRLQPTEHVTVSDGRTTSDVMSGDLVVRPHAPTADAPRPVPQAPAPSPDRLGAWTVTIAVVLDADVAGRDEEAVDRAVSALFSDGPQADLQAAITRPDGSHRRVALRPLDASRPSG